MKIALLLSCLLSSSSLTNADDATTTEFQKLAPGAAASCSEGYEITTVQDCKVAGSAFNGFVNHGEVLQGNWNTAPCGCFIKNGATYLNEGKDGCSESTHSLLCKKIADVDKDEMLKVAENNLKPIAQPKVTPTVSAPLSSEVEAVDSSFEKLAAGAASSCPQGLEITTLQDCRVAGSAFNGFVNDGEVLQGNWNTAPCGCFIKHGATYFDDGKESCSNSPITALICRKIAGKINDESVKAESTPESIVSVTAVESAPLTSGILMEESRPQPIVEDPQSEGKEQQASQNIDSEHTTNSNSQPTSISDESSSSEEESSSEDHSPTIVKKEEPAWEKELERLAEDLEQLRYSAGFDRGVVYAMLMFLCFTVGIAYNFHKRTQYMYQLLTQREEDIGSFKNQINKNNREFYV